MGNGGKAPHILNLGISEQSDPCSCHFSLGKESPASTGQKAGLAPDLGWT